MPNLSFTEHPATVGETYLEHLRSAAGFSFQMIGAGLACLVHGVFPFLFTATGSSAIRSLNERLVLNRARHAEEVAARPIERNHAPAARFS
jgi:hypothetical protein